MFDIWNKDMCTIVHLYKYHNENFLFLNSNGLNLPYHVHVRETKFSCKY